MKYFSLTILTLIIFTGCQHQPLEKVEKNKLTEKIDAYLKEAVERIHIPGLTVAATRNDSLVYIAAFGVRSIDTKEPMKPGYDFHWASVSKTVVATAIMQLVEQGKIKLDEKLITYLPYFKQKGENYKVITIRQMLNHTSGIGDVEDYEWDKPQYDEGSAERYVRSLEKDTMIFVPGKDWAYSNIAFDIMADVIAKVSGMPFETYIKKNIFEPLEMTNTSFIYPEIPDSLRVTGHVWAAMPKTSKVYPYNRMHAPSSTVNSNVLEMTHYAKANLHRGKYKDVRILSDSSYNLLWTNSVNMDDKPKVGVSWFLEEYKGMKTMSHSGGDTGFRSFLLLIPEKNISVALVSNYELTRTQDFAYAILDILLGSEPAMIKQQVGFPFAEIAKEEGIEKAKAFYLQTKNDSTQRKYFLWKEDDGAMVYPGYLLADQGLLNEALEVFKYNLELNPTSSYAYAHVGVVYAKLGNTDLAKVALKKSLKIDPSNKYSIAELKKLKKRN